MARIVDFGMFCTGIAYLCLLAVSTPADCPSHLPEKKTTSSHNFDVYTLTGMDKASLDSAWSHSPRCDSLIEMALAQNPKPSRMQVRVPEGFASLLDSNSFTGSCLQIQREFQGAKAPRALRIVSYGQTLQGPTITLQKLGFKHRNWILFLGCEKDRANLLTMAPELGFQHLFEIPFVEGAEMTARLYIPTNALSAEEQNLPVQSKEPKYRIQR